jgi:hypothetical protein
LDFLLVASLVTEITAALMTAVSVDGGRHFRDFARDSFAPAYPG